MVEVCVVRFVQQLNFLLNHEIYFKATGSRSVVEEYIIRTIPMWDIMSI